MELESSSNVEEKSTDFKLNSEDPAGWEEKLHQDPRQGIKL